MFEFLNKTNIRRNWPYAIIPVALAAVPAIMVFCAVYERWALADPFVREQRLVLDDQKIEELKKAKDEVLRTGGRYHDPENGKEITVSNVAAAIKELSSREAKYQRDIERIKRIIKKNALPTRHP